MKIWYDVTDIVDWQSNLTGIQRTTVGILNALLTEGIELELVRFLGRQQRFERLSIGELPHAIRQHLHQTDVRRSQVPPRPSRPRRLPGEDRGRGGCLELARSQTPCGSLCESSKWQFGRYGKAWESGPVPAGSGPGTVDAQRECSNLRFKKWHRRPVASQPRQPNLSPQETLMSRLERRGALCTRRRWPTCKSTAFVSRG